MFICSFEISGPNTYLFTIRRNHSINTVCSAVFIDRLTGSRTYFDDIPLPWLGNVSFVPQEVSYSLVTSEQLSPAVELWKALASDSQAMRPPAWQDGLLAYRLAASKDIRADTTLLESWRWNLRLWTQDDHERFNDAAAQGLARRGGALPTVEPEIPYLPMISINY